MELLEGGRMQWIFDAGPHKDHLCALMQPNLNAFDVYVPAAQPEPESTKLLTAAPWLHYATRGEAMAVVDGYCSAPGPVFQ